MMDPRKIGQFLMGEWDKTSQPLQERGSVLPVGIYEDGRAGLAWPNILAAPAQAASRAVQGGQDYWFDDAGHVSPGAISDSLDIAGGAMTGSLGTAALGKLADDAVRAGRPRGPSTGPKAAPSPSDPNALFGEIIDSPQEMVRRAQQSPLWPKSWFEDAAGHAGRPQTFENLLDAARFVYRFEAEDKWNDAVARAAGGSKPVGNARQQAEAAAFSENPKLWWDSRRTLQEQVEGRDGPMSEFDRVWDRVDAPPTTDVVDELLGTGIINDAYLGPAIGRPNRLNSNPKTGATVPLLQNALERSQPQVSKNAAGRDVYDFGGGTTVTMKDWPSGGRMVDNVYTDPLARGQGQARQAMEYIIAEADKSGTPLKLAVSPGDPSVDPQRLQSFYEGLGFDYLGGGYMNRSPRALEQPQGIRAYHGSPHDFDRFDLSKIGTGEGAQAYGHGLYFAEAEDVARSYRDQLSGDMASQFPDEASALAAAGPGGKAFKNSLGWAALDANGKAVSYNVPGRMYEVNIKANPEDFLDWDKPLSQQSEAVNRAFDKLNGKRVLGQLTGAPINPLPREYFKGKPATGEFIHREIAGVLDGKVEAAELLKELGIPGIKYLDAMSRGSGDGSSNYVVFDDQLIDILRKYANAPTGAALPLAGEAQDTDPALLEYLKSIGLY